MRRVPGWILLALVLLPAAVLGLPFPEGVAGPGDGVAAVGLADGSVEGISMENGRRLWIIHRDARPLWAFPGRIALLLSDSRGLFVRFVAPRTGRALVETPPFGRPSARVSLETRFGPPCDFVLAAALQGGQLVLTHTGGDFHIPPGAAPPRDLLPRPAPERVFQRHAVDPQGGQVADLGSTTLEPWSAAAPAIPAGLKALLPAGSSILDAGDGDHFLASAGLAGAWEVWSLSKGGRVGKVPGAKDPASGQPGIPAVIGRRTFRWINEPVDQNFNTRMERATFTFECRDLASGRLIWTHQSPTTVPMWSPPPAAAR